LRQRLSTRWKKWEKEVLEREEIEQILDFNEENESSTLPLQTQINPDLAGGEKTDEI